MNIVSSYVTKEELHQEMQELINIGAYPSKNAIIKAGIRKVIDENKKQNGENK